MWVESTVTSSTVLQSTLTVTSSARFESNAVVAGHVQLGSLIDLSVVEQLSLGSSSIRPAHCVDLARVPLHPLHKYRTLMCLALYLPTKRFL